MRVVPFLLLALTGFLHAEDASLIRVVRDPLKSSWPWDLVSLDFPASIAPNLCSVRVGSELRPVQVELVNEKVARVWFHASMSGKDSDGTLRLQFDSEAPTSATKIHFQKTEDGYRIDNGLATFQFSGSQKKPMPFSMIRPFLSGLEWNGRQDGRMEFKGDSMVDQVEVAIVNQGSVFIDLAYTFHFTKDSSPPSSCSAPILSLGKQSFRWPLNQPPFETTKQYQRAYQILVRVVAGDPWVEFAERFSLPPGHGYSFTFGAPRPTETISAPLPIDTILWPRWFEYDRFGGNCQQLVFPCAPRPEQMGRPFATLRPVWTQMGALSQDIWFTSGATRSSLAPCVGVVTAFPSKWVNPYPNRPTVEVASSGRATLYFPLTDGKGAGFHYGHRSWALCLGPRSLFDSTEKANTLVRRHTDWTLNALANRYILDWPRDPAKAGPHIIATKDQIALVRANITGTPQGPLAQALERCRLQRKSLQDELAKLRQQISAKKIQEQIKKLEGELQSPGWILLDLIDGLAVKPSSIPDAALFLSRRYSDDFLNPTSSPIRRWFGGAALADLTAGSLPAGGPAQAAAAYIFSDPDAWPGWMQGWHPGNPNFHTDKIRPLAGLAALLSDHPHQKDWLMASRVAFEEDLDRVMSAPDGVAYECPGYSGIGGHAIQARYMMNGGVDLTPRLPLFAASGRWHRYLLTPPDTRLGGRRHEAPLGDTHRWFSGAGGGFADLATLFSPQYPKITAEFLCAAQLAAPDQREDDPEVVIRLMRLDPSVKAANPLDLDWNSRTFEGFGAILRNGFGTPQESFCTVKAGRMHGHYHNDDLSFHFYADATPISLDYNCSYHPRGDHAALHNAVTFGKDGQVLHNQRQVQVLAREQLHGRGNVLATAFGPHLDAIVTERMGKYLTLSPVDPADAEFGRAYPSRQPATLTHRRTLCHVKHPAESSISDYLVIRDEVSGPEPAQINIHLLARSATTHGNTVHAVGQYSHDILVAAISPTASGPTLGRWFYEADSEKHPVPKEILRKPDETEDAWGKRTASLDIDPDSENPSPTWNQILKASDGQVLIPPPNWTKPWKYGEYQISVRYDLARGSDCIWVLVPYRRGVPAPKIEAIVTEGVRVGTEEISFKGVKNNLIFIKQNGVSQKSNLVVEEPRSLKRSNPAIRLE